MSDEELAAEKRLAHDREVAADAGPATGTFHKSSALVVVLAWTAVGIPLAWGVYRTLQSVGKFFN